jgi:hypothetical protein
VVKDGFKYLLHNDRKVKYQKYLCKNCGHKFVPSKIKSSRYDSLSLQAQIVFEYLLKRSLRNIKTSKAVGHVGKDKILEILLSVSSRLPDIFSLNKILEIRWTGKFAFDGTFFKIGGKLFVLLLCSDFESLDVVGYMIAPLENYKYWKQFLDKISIELSRCGISKFYVTDGKKGLHQALSELYPHVPTQLCTTHKQRRINQIIPHVRGDGYDKLFSHLAHRAIRAPIKEAYQAYLGILVAFRSSHEYASYPDSRKEKLKKIIGALRFQKSKLHTRYNLPDEIIDPTTNHLEGINSFLQERIDLMRGFKKSNNAELLIKLLILYYRFHKFTSSSFKERNGKCPIQLNALNNQKLLTKILNGNTPSSWIRNLLSSP